MQTYEVTATYEIARYSVSSRPDGAYSYTIAAKTKAEAVSIARKRVWRDGHTRQDGALRFTAQKAEG